MNAQFDTEHSAENLTGRRGSPIGNPFHLRYFNDGFCALTGHTADELDGALKRDIRRIIVDEDVGNYNAAVAQLREIGDAVVASYRVKRADGTTVALSDTMVCQTNAAGEKGITSIIAPQEQGASDNGESVEDLAAGLIEFTFADRLQVLYANKRALDMFEITDEQLAHGRMFEKPSDFAPKGDLFRIVETVEKASESNSIISGSFTLFTASGKPFQTFVWLRCVKGDGEQERFHAVIVDVSRNSAPLIELGLLNYITALYDLYDDIFEFDTENNTVRCYVSRLRLVPESFLRLRFMTDDVLKMVFGSGNSAKNSDILDFIRRSLSQKESSAVGNVDKLTFKCVIRGETINCIGTMLHCRQGRYLFCVRRYNTRGSSGAEYAMPAVIKADSNLSVTVIEYDYNEGRLYVSGSYDKYMIKYLPVKSVGYYDFYKKYVHPGDMEIIRAQLEKAKKGAVSFEYDIRLRMVDGTYRKTRVSTVLVVSAYGKRERLLTTLTDLHDRLKLEMAFGMRHDAIDELQDKSEDAIFAFTLLDGHARIVYLNRYAFRLFGCEPSDDPLDTLPGGAAQAQTLMSDADYVAMSQNGESVLTAAGGERLYCICISDLSKPDTFYVLARPLASVADVHLSPDMRSVITERGYITFRYEPATHKVEYFGSSNGELLCDSFDMRNLLKPGHMLGADGLKQLKSGIINVVERGSCESFSIKLPDALWPGLSLKIIPIPIKNRSGQVSMVVGRAINSLHETLKADESAAVMDYDVFRRQFNQLAGDHEQTNYMLSVVSVDDYAECRARYGADGAQNISNYLIASIQRIAGESLFIVRISENRLMLCSTRVMSAGEMIGYMSTLSECMRQAGEGVPAVTCSIGVSHIEGSLKSGMDDGYRRAADAHARAIAAGGDRVLLYEDGGSESIGLIPGTNGYTPHVYLRAFGSFELFVDGRAVYFKSTKAKELLALLIDRRGGFVTTADGIAALWPDEPAGDVQSARYRKVAMRLREILEENGAPDIVTVINGKRSINLNKVRCDLFDYESGRPEYRGLYSGDYMLGYDWAKKTRSELRLTK